MTAIVKNNLTYNTPFIAWHNLTHTTNTEGVHSAMWTKTYVGV